MKKLILLTFLGFLAYNAIAQKAKNRSVEFKYYHLPSNPLRGNVSKYAVIVNNTSTKVKIGNDRIESYLNLQGFEKVAPSNAGVILEFSVYGVQANIDVKTKEVTEKVDDKDVKKTKYYYELTSKTSSKFVLKYKSGQIIKSMDFNGGSYLYSEKSGLYDTKAEVQKLFNSKKVALEKNADDSGLQLVLDEVKKYLDDHHAYYYVAKYESVATGKGKKHDYTELDEAIETYRDAAAEYGVKGVSEGFINKSNECIEVWKSAISEFDANDKKARISKKNIDRFYWNVAVAYLYMNEFDKAVQTLNEAMTVGKSTVSEKYFIGQIKNRKNRYELNEKRKLEFSSSVTSASTNNTSTNTENNSTNKNNTFASIGKAVFVPSKGINNEYRVKKVSKTYKNGISEYVEITNFYYDGDKLIYKLIDSEKKVDSIAYNYSSGSVNTSQYSYSKAMGKKWIKSNNKDVSYSIINNLVVKKTTRSEELIYKYNETGGLDALIRKKLLYGNIMYKYTFHFIKDKLSQIKTYRFRDGEWVEQEDQILNFNHKNFTIQQSEYGTVYELDYRNGPLSRIQKYKNFNVEKEDMSYLFFYDTNGNINKQKFKNSFGNTEIYDIEYEQKEGNEKLFLGTRDWRANTFFHQITFNDFFEADY
ncbi:MAG: hypothetical protein ABFS35_21290 [Bacteroidota bacterium]